MRTTGGFIPPWPPAKSRRASRCRGSFNGVCRGTDHVEHKSGVGKHGNVAAGDLMRGRAHTFRQEALQLRMDGAVVGGQDVPARLRPPGSTIKLLLEQV